MPSYSSPRLYPVSKKDRRGRSPRSWTSGHRLRPRLPEPDPIACLIIIDRLQHNQMSLRPHLYTDDELRRYLQERGFPLGNKVSIEQTGVYNSGEHEGRHFADVRVYGVPGVIEYTATIFLGDVTHGWQGLTPTERMMKG